MPVNRVGDFGSAPGILGCSALFKTVDFSTLFVQKIFIYAITATCI